MKDRTGAILNQFTDSWRETERFFNDLTNNYAGLQRLNSLRIFIDELKQKGEDRFFRLGNSMDRLLISRSVNHGLRRDQKYIMIEAYDEKFEVTLRNGDKTYRQYMVENLGDERVSKLLKTLKDTLID